MKLVIISAVNFVEGGPLTILKEALESIEKYCRAKDISVLALVSNKNICFIDGIQYMEFPRSRKSWIIRLYYEYIYFYFLSKKFRPYLWISLHDTTPNVLAENRIVYCHNPAPFYKCSLREVFYDPVFFVFNKLYKFIYRVNIRKNRYVVVQQKWLADAFRSMFELDNIVIANPTVKGAQCSLRKKGLGEKFVILYPAFPRVFKNFEVLLEAYVFLPQKEKEMIELRLTIDGNENRYAKYLYGKYSAIKGVKFIGFQDSANMERQYYESDLIAFPSKLETWGLPMTEAIIRDKTLAVSDLPYARETVKSYNKVVFLEPTSPKQWCDAFIHIRKYGANFVDGEWCQDDRYINAVSWPELWRIILN